MKLWLANCEIINTTCKSNRMRFYSHRLWNNYLFLEVKLTKKKKKPVNPEDVDDIDDDFESDWFSFFIFLKRHERERQKIEREN